jgi:hypothetical protein
VNHARRTNGGCDSARWRRAQIADRELLSLLDAALLGMSAFDDPCGPRNKHKRGAAAGSGLVRWRCVKVHAGNAVSAAGPYQHEGRAGNSISNSQVGIRGE